MLHWWWLCVICVICHVSCDGYNTHHFFVEACWHRYLLEYWSHGIVIGYGGFSSALINDYNPFAWYRPFLMMSTLLIHMWSNPIAKRSHPSKGTCLDHIWSKSTVWQSPPTRGTFRATFGWSQLRDKVLQRGAHFGPHLVEVRCVTKSFNERHISGHIWSKSAAWQSPPMRGTFRATFGRSPLHDKVLQWGAHFGPHLIKVRCVTMSSNKGHILGHIW